MREGVLHIHDVEGPKKTGSMEARLEAMEQQVFKCQGMVERGLNANHMMITEFTNKNKIDANGKHLSRLYDRIDHLQAQIYDLQNQNSPFEEPKALDTSASEVADLTIGTTFVPTSALELGAVHMLMRGSTENTLIPTSSATRGSTTWIEPEQSCGMSPIEILSYTS
ncbi:40S ribosomal protein S5-1 [Hordeum vulgare]|nr:40S ribosomal protein S5-1 [Hordeum vulgare]